MSAAHRQVRSNRRTPRVALQCRAAPKLPSSSKGIELGVTVVSIPGYVFPGLWAPSAGSSGDTEHLTMAFLQLPTCTWRTSMDVGYREAHWSIGFTVLPHASHGPHVAGSGPAAVHQGHRNKRPRSMNLTWHVTREVCRSACNRFHALPACIPSLRSCAGWRLPRARRHG